MKIEFAVDSPAVPLQSPSLYAPLAKVVFPPVRDAPQALPRAIAHTALVRVPKDGTLWLLRTRGAPWTDERLHAAVAVLARAGVKDSAAEVVEYHLAEAVAGPPISVRRPRLDGVDWDQWDIRNVAVARVLDSATQTTAAPDAREMMQRVDALVASYAAEIEASHAQLFATLDPEALAITRSDGAQLPTYNYLVRAPHRRNRIQFAATFPLLLRRAVQDEVAGNGAPLGRFVDEGTPLVKALARQWRVSPSTLRCIIRVPVRVAGVRWTDRPRDLLVTLDALRAEDRPKPDAASWARFNRLACQAEEMFGRRLTSALPLSWLREAAACSRHLPESSGVEAAVDAGMVVLVDELRAALVDALANAPLHGGRSHDADPASASRDVADAFLTRLSPRRLARLAADYRRHLAALHLHCAAARADFTGGCFWSLLDEPYVSADDSRRIVPLDSLDALRVHGLALNNCLRGGTGDEYASLGRRGRAFVLGVLDEASGAPLSTVELRPRRPQPHLPLSLRVVQHTAANNVRATAACRAAVDELVRLFAREPHLGRLQAVVRNARAGIDRRRAGEMEAQEEALRRAIGAKSYERLLAA